jgi:hypothetical protein
MIIAADVGGDLAALKRVTDSKRDWMVFVSADSLLVKKTAVPVLRAASEIGGVIDDKRASPYFLRKLTEPLNTGWWITNLLMCEGEVRDREDLHEKLQANVTNDVIYRIGDSTALRAISMDSPVAVTPGLLYDRMGPWELSGRRVWIHGGSAVDQWRVFAELLVAGIGVEGIVFDSAFWRRKADQRWTVCRNIYQWTREFRNKPAKCAVETLRNVYDFWREIRASLGEV